MKDIRHLELAELATGIPKIDYSLGVHEALRAFEEYVIYDYLVVVKEDKPVGILRKLDLIKAQHRQDIQIGELAVPLMKLRNAVVKPEDLIALRDFFNSSKTPMFLVDKKGKYIGLLFYEVVLHHVSLFKEASVPVFQKLKHLFRQRYYFYGFRLGGLKGFKEQFGHLKSQGLLKVLYENVKEIVEGDVALSYEQEEVYALSKFKLTDAQVRQVYEEFHREFALLYAEAKPIYVRGYSIPLEEVSDFDHFLKLKKDLEARLESVQDVSCFIFHGKESSIVMCEYGPKDFINSIKEKIKSDFASIVERLRRSDRDLWEYVLYDFFKEYPYFELFYVMNEKGVQVSNNVINPKVKYPVKVGKKGADRSEKEYFKQASYEGVYISPIYISQATDDFCITVSKKFRFGERSYVLAGDINYRQVHSLVKSYAQSPAYR